MDTPAAVAVVSPDGALTGWSPGAQRLLRYSADEVVGLLAADLLASPLPDTARARLAARESWSGRVTLRDRDGDPVECALRARPLVDGDGRTSWLLEAALPRTGDDFGDAFGDAVGGGMKSGADQAGDRADSHVAGDSAHVAGGAGHVDDRAVDHHVTGRTDHVDGLAFDRAVDLAEDRLQRWAYLQSPFAQGIFDTEGRILRINAMFERNAAASTRELRGLRLDEALHGPVFEADQALIDRVAATGRGEYVERFVHLPGEPQAHAWAIHVSPLKDPAGRVRGVMQSALDFTEQYNARERLALLNEASRRIGSSLDVTRTAQELADVAVPGFGDFISVDLLDAVLHGDEPAPIPAAGPLRLRRAALRSIVDPAVETGQLADYPASSPPTRSLVTGRGAVHLVSDPEISAWMAQDPARAAWVREHWPHSFLLVPLRARGTNLGVVMFARLDSSIDPYGPADLEIAEELAGRAAVCIDNARRYTRERHTALALQESLLPRSLPEQAAVEVASRYLPAGSLAGAGGDWFDVIPLSGARVALAVGDVVGHGIHASAAMGRLRTAVRTLADVDLPPDELLSHLDDLVVRLGAESGGEADDTSGGLGAATGLGGTGGLRATGGLGAGDFGGSSDLGATCLYAVYDPISRRCAMASAGHPPPVLVAPDGTVDVLDLAPGPPLGLGGLPFEAYELDVPQGSLLALYTDGLIEARHRDIDDGLRTLCNALSDAVPPSERTLGGAPSLERTCDTVLKAMLDTRPADDVALLIARTRALDAAHVAVWDLPADPAVVAEARIRVGEQLRVWGLEELTFVTELVASELVTNAIRYAAPPIQLRLIKDRSLVCEVSDASSTAPHLRRARTFDEGGRGLMLVAQLTERWGTRHTGTGKTIWAEQATARPRPPR
ncbi:SpoIIE family protein phosphatase [Streptomyces sp. P1-3]|uniref:SpoIIE family protein phosphatase n=1 Tax=Streptomyces sp. P1-3 TaxID=3421658 RepID=UPI003D3672AE